MNRRNKNTIAAPPPAAAAPPPSEAPPVPTYLPTWRRVIYFTAPFLIYIVAFFGPFLEYDELAEGTKEGFMIGFGFLNELIFKETGHKLTRPLLVLAIKTWKVVTIWGVVWLAAMVWLYYRLELFDYFGGVFNMGIFWVVLGWFAGSFCSIMYSAPLVLDWWIQSIGE
jgi:hypothetical protein